MVGTMRLPLGWMLSTQSRSGTWGKTDDPWRLARVGAEPDPSAGEYGLLAPALGQEPDLPHAGLLSQSGTAEPSTTDQDALPMPDRKPTPPSQYKMRPGALRDDVLPMPPYLDRDDWYAFDHALRRSGMQTETEIETARRIFGFEGGIRRPKKGNVVAGITPTILKHAMALGVVSTDDPTAMSIDEAASAYKLYFDEQLGRIGPNASLAQIGDSMAAGQFMDLLFHFGGRGGTEVIQQGINDTIARLSDADMHRLAVFPLEEDGSLGPLTFDVFNRLVNSGYGHRLRNNIADRALDRIDVIYAHLTAGRNPRMDPSDIPHFSDRTDQFR